MPLCTLPDKNDLISFHKPKTNDVYKELRGDSLIRGVFSVGGSVSLIVMRKTVILRRALIPKVTFSPDSEGT